MRVLHRSLVVLVAALVAACGGSLGPVSLPVEADARAAGCRLAPVPGRAVRDGDPMAPGEPMAGLDVSSMTGLEVGHAAVARGLRVSWRYCFAIGEPSEGGQTGFSECWCVPPPEGRVVAVSYGTAGELVVMVKASQGLTAPRPQPELGWGC